MMIRKIYYTAAAVAMLGILTAAGSCGSSKDDGGGVVIPPADLSSTTGIDKFSDKNLFSRNTNLISNYALQSFSIDSSDGSIWYLQSDGVNKQNLNLVNAAPNSATTIMDAKTDFMKLAYFGHGTNADIEEVGDERYLWLGAYGTCASNGQYWTERVVGRVKYKKGATVKTNECEEYYYMGDYTDLQPAIDMDNDLLTINYADNKSNSAYRCFVVYKLSEAKKAPFKTFQIECTNGFQTNNPTSTTKMKADVYCRDLTTLTPVAQMKFLKSGYGGAGAVYYPWQGYDVYKDRLYYFEGQSNYNLNSSVFTGKSFAYVTVFDFKGNILEERTQVAFISDNTLKEISVSFYNTAEAEGIKVHKGKLYLGFTARGQSEGNTAHYQNIFVFDQSTK